MKHRSPTGAGKQSEPRGGGVGYKAGVLQSEFCKVKMLRKSCTFRKEYAVGFLLFLAISIIWLWAFNTNSFWKADALDYAQMGRELGRGKGFSTLQTFPRHIRFFQEKGYLEKENWPNLYRYPLPVILNAFFYKITGDITISAILQSGLAFLLSIPMLFILATRLTNLKVGIISTIFYAADPLFFTGSYEGMTEPITVFLLLCLFLVAFSQRLSRWKCLSMGIICGLSYLNRNQFVFLVPLTALYMWFNTEKRMKVGGLVLLLVGFLLAVSPWLARNMVVAGNPVFSFNTSRCLTSGCDDPKLSHLQTRLDAPVESLIILKEHGPAIAKKVLKNLLAGARLSFWARAFSPKSGILIFFLFASIIYRRHSAHRRYDSFRNAVFFLFVGNYLILSLLFHNIRYHAPVMAFIYIVGINEILVLFGDPGFGRWMKLKHIVLLGMLLLGIARLYNTVMIEKDRPSPLSANDKKSYEIIRQVAGDDTVIASSTSFKIACYVGCRAFRLPMFGRSLLKINDSYLPVDYVLINKNILDSDTKRYASYGEFIESDEFLKTFQFAKELPNGAVLFKRL